MLKLIKSSVVFLLLFSTNLMFADNHVPNFFPMESYQCKFEEGKGPSDLLRVADSWNKYADKETPSYAAWLMIPNFITSSDYDVDGVWLGAWPTWQDSASTQEKLAGSAGNDQLDKFRKVWDCPTHAAYGTLTLRESTTEPSEDPFLVSVSNCTMSEGKGVMDLMGAWSEWNKYLDSLGLSSGAWAMFKGPGNPINASWDFKLLVGSSFSDQGTFAEAFVNGGGILRGQNVFEGIVECDIQRQYNTYLMRAPSN